MYIISCRTFLDNLKKSNLLTAEQLQATRAATREYRDSLNLSAWLIKQGWLTRWQVQQLLAGKTSLFLGKYKLLEVLGQGGMGGVLKAEQPSVNRIVALKIMVKQLVNNEQARSRFQREIRSAAALNHPNIVSAIDADCVGDRHFFVMEYVDGKDLKIWIKEYGRLPIDWSAECIRQAALGLQHAHEQGIVHRDIKPSNVLVTTNPETGELTVKILDLGLARFASELEADGDVTHTGQIMGSPDYIAPEQAQNARTADVRSDIFGLGCTFFHLLTGELPFHGANVMEKLMTRATTDAPHAASLRPEIPPALDQLVAKMLVRDPNGRIQTSGEVAAELGAFRSGAGVATTSEEMPTAPVDASNKSTITPKADETLNDFFEQLTNNVVADAPSYSHSTSRRQKKKSPAMVVTSIMVTGVLLLITVGYLLSRPRNDDPQDSQSAAEAMSASTPKPIDKSTTPKRDDSPHRRLARWATKSGSGIKIQVNQDQMTITQPDNIPPSAFKVVEVGLQGIQQFPDSYWRLINDVEDIHGLNFNGSRLTDEQLTQLGNQTSLVFLDLGSTLVTDLGIVQLKGLEKLHSLDLEFTHVSDNGLKWLPSMQNLKNLNLAGTDISDASVKTLGQMTGLVSLDLRYTVFSQQSISRLKTLLSNCEILHD